MITLKIVDVPLAEECLKRNCRTCKDYNCIVESFSLVLDENGVKQVTNDFKCKNCREIILPHARNGYKTFKYSQNLKKKLLGFTEVNLSRDVFAGEIYYQGIKNLPSFKKDEIVYVPEQPNILSQYDKLNLDDFIEDKENTTIFVFNEKYEPVPVLFPKNALGAGYKDQRLSKKMF